MKDLTRIRITVLFDDGVGNEEEYRLLLDSVHQADGSVKFVPKEVERLLQPYAMSWPTAHMICQKLTNVREFLEEHLLNPDALAEVE